MALPFLIPLLLGGAVIGGATAKKRNQSFLQGALQGALVGGLGSVGAGAVGLGAAGTAGLGAAGAAGAGAGAAGAAGTAATTAPLSGAVATAAPSIAAPVSTPLSLGQIGKTGTALAKSAGSPAAYAKTLGLSAPTAASTASSAPMAAINKQIAELGIKEAAPSTFDKILATAKDKPMKTMQFASALGGGEQQQAPAPSMAPITQPGGFGNVPTIEESIGMDSGPRFISKGLFDESKRSMEEEEMALMYQKLSEAGLV